MVLVKKVLHIYIIKDVMNMKGIYKYTDLKTGEIVYVGKDSHIDKHSRHKEHLTPSKYNQQQINRVLQNNPNRYEYGVIWATEDCTTLKLNKMEILFGKIYNPKFNFGKFGKGGCNGHTEESKQKMRETKLSELNPNFGKGNSGISHVHKSKSNRYAQGYIWVYKKIINGVTYRKRSVNLRKLEKNVLNDNQEWIILDENKAIKSYNESDKNNKR